MEEKDRLEIELECAWLKERTVNVKIPPNAKLNFEVELVDIDWDQCSKSKDISDNKDLALKLNLTK